MSESVRATAADAQLVLQLYEMRREEVMRKARHFAVYEFWPQDISDLTRLTGNPAATESQYLRQVVSYWEMAAALVLRGALHEELFFDTAGELYFMYAKLKPFIEGMRETAPDFLRNCEKLVSQSPAGRERVERMEKNQAKRMAAATGKSVH